MKKISANLVKNRNYLAFVLVFMVIGGIVLLLNTHAQSPFASSEAETGALGGSASTVIDNLASGGSAIKFGAASTGTGTWVNVTPANMDLINGDCQNFGTQTVVADPARPSNIYAEDNCQGIWKSTDYGQTWTGPINTGTNGATAGDCAGGISIAQGPSGQPPILYESCIRGNALWQGVSGFWRSLDGGASWSNYPIAPAPAGRGDVYAPAVDPYNSNHLIMAGHEQNLLVQSVDGGQTWTNVNLNSGMLENGGTAFPFFINTGNATTTAQTWLYTAQGTGGTVGTWRTTNGGASWTQVDTNEHPHGTMQIYQPNTSGVVYMAGVYSGLGWGVLRSTDYGQTWTHVGTTGNEAIVFGTPNNVYADYSWACGSCTVDPAFESAPLPGINWDTMATPAGMAMGPAEAAVVFNGSKYVIVAANWQSGLWRYIEP